MHQRKFANRRQSPSPLLDITTPEITCRGHRWSHSSQAQGEWAAAVSSPALQNPQRRGIQEPAQKAPRGLSQSVPRSRQPEGQEEEHSAWVQAAVVW